MRAFLRYVILPGLGSVLLLLAAAAAAIIWGTAAPPQPLASINQAAAQCIYLFLPAVAQFQGA